jgi:hypothetical protein
LIVIARVLAADAARMRSLENCIFVKDRKIELQKRSTGAEGWEHEKISRGRATGQVIYISARSSALLSLRRSTRLVTSPYAPGRDYKSRLYTYTAERTSLPETLWQRAAQKIEL